MRPGPPYVLPLRSRRGFAMNGQDCGVALTLAEWR